MLLSVIMTNYNHGHFLESRLHSILEQLPDDAELLIVDDASTDDSVAIIQKIAQNEPRIRLSQNTKNQGVVSSVNRALQEARGTYIASLAADDKILPGFIEKTLNVLLAFPDIAICCSDCGLSFDGFPNRNPDTIETSKLLEGVTEVQIFRPKKLLSVFQNTHFWIPGHTSIIKRASLLRFGGFDPRLEFLCDWLLIHTIALTEGVAYIPETLSVWRQHPKTYSAECQSNTDKMKRAYRNLFVVLSETTKRSVRPLIRKSTILHFYVKELFRELLFRPQYWDFLAAIVVKVLRRRFRRYFGLKREGV